MFLQVALFTRAWIEIFQNKVLLARIRGRRIIKSSATYSLIINVYNKLDPSVFTEGSDVIALKTVYQNAFL